MRQHRALVAPHLKIDDASGRIVEDQYGPMMRLGVFHGAPDHARHVAQRAGGEQFVSAKGGDCRRTHVRPDVLVVL